ncbi:MAG TPA: class I SAM-dependent methyltransferase [Actinomycetota bacterium]|nr:class I SAM-dependent methyltransferase [Actinomycetota bacterium]
MPSSMHAHDHAHGHDHGGIEGVSPLGFTGERVIPGDPKWAWCFQAHLFGYHDLARRMTSRPERLLEIGCGEGYGASVLSRHAGHVVAGDVAADAVAHARDKYHAPNISWVVFDAQKLPFADGAFGVTCSLQVIEHFPDAEAHLDEVVRVTEPGGLHYVTTPNIDNMGEAEKDNPFHLRDFNAADLDAVLSARFDDVAVEGMFYVEDSPRYRRMVAAEAKEERLRPKLRKVEDRLAKLPGALRVRLRPLARKAAGVSHWPLPEAERARNEIIAADFRAGPDAEQSFCLIGVGRTPPRKGAPAKKGPDSGPGRSR